MKDNQAIKQVVTANQLVKQLEKDFPIEEVCGIIEIAKIFALERYNKVTHRRLRKNENR